MADHTSYVRREPIGVCAQVTPWNYPMMMAVWKFAPALAAGNTVVLKPSDTTPVTTLLLAEIAAEFLPPGVLNVVCGDRDTGRALVAHPTPQMVSITGSIRAGHGGRRVGRAATSSGSTWSWAARPRSSSSTTPTSRRPPRRIAGAGYFNAGQDCTAATRVLVARADRTTTSWPRSPSRPRDTKTGAPDDEDALYGPLNNANQLARVSGFLDRLPDHAEVVAGGTRVGDRGYFFAPTVVAGLRQDDEMIQDEVFGPVITVQTFTDEAEARALGQRRAVRPGRQRLDHATTAARCGCPSGSTSARSGSTPTSRSSSEMPHGGFKHSGYGKDLSMYGLEDYTRIKHVMHYIGDQATATVKPA